MNWAIQLLVTDEQIEFEKESVEVEDFKRIMHRFGGICGICFKFMKENRNIAACCNRLDLEKHGFLTEHVRKSTPDTDD